MLGQYDNHGNGSPPGSVCAGYPYYVNLVEPAESKFQLTTSNLYYRVSLLTINFFNYLQRITVLDVSKTKLNSIQAF